MNKKIATPSTEAATLSRQDDHSRKQAVVAKYKRVLRFMLEHGSITRLQAERQPVYDHCLNSTISEMIRRHGLVFESVVEKRSGYGGIVATYKRYSVAESCLDAAKAIAWGEVKS